MRWDGSCHCYTRVFFHARQLYYQSGKGPLSCPAARTGGTCCIQAGSSLQPSCAATARCLLLPCHKPRQPERASPTPVWVSPRVPDCLGPPMQHGDPFNIFENVFGGMGGGQRMHFQFGGGGMGGMGGMGGGENGKSCGSVADAGMRGHASTCTLSAPALQLLGRLAEPFECSIGPPVLFYEAQPSHMPCLQAWAAAEGGARVQVFMTTTRLCRWGELCRDSVPWSLRVWWGLRYPSCPCCHYDACQSTARCVPPVRAPGTAPHVSACPVQCLSHHVHVMSRTCIRVCLCAHACLCTPGALTCSPPHLERRI